MENKRRITNNNLNESREHVAKVIRIVKQEVKVSPCESCWSKSQLPSCNVLCIAFSEWCAYQDMLESNTIEIKVGTKPPNWIKYRKQYCIAMYEGKVVNPDIAPEWGGFDVCEDCYNKYY
jgi:hypothetical protein